MPSWKVTPSLSVNVYDEPVLGLLPALGEERRGVGRAGLDADETLEDLTGDAERLAVARERRVERGGVVDAPKTNVLSTSDDSSLPPPSSRSLAHAVRAIAPIATIATPDNQRFLELWSMCCAPSMTMRTNERLTLSSSARV